MTKPTYSELETSLARANADAERAYEKLEGANESLARVRGLLQHGVELVQPQACSDSFCGDTGHVKVKEWLSEAGAESADIGKLDTADKSGVVIRDN